MVLAAMQAGDENADYVTARERFHKMLNEPFQSRFIGRDLEESELRVAVGLSA